MHRARQFRIRCQLDRGRGLRAETRSAPRGEGDQIRARGHLPRRRHRIISGAVHIDEPSPVQLFGIGESPCQRRQPALGHRAQRFLQDRRQTALFIARARVVIQRGPVLARVIAPPVDHIADFLASGRIRPRDQQMLRAENLWRFRQDRGAARCDQEIRGHAKRRVRGDPRKPVRSAALHPQNQLRDRLLGPLILIGLRRNRLQQFQGAPHRRA